MGSREAQTYLASAEVVAASALSGTISGPDGFKVPANWSGVVHGFGTGPEKTTESELASIIQQLDSYIERVESAEVASERTTEIVAGFPEKISGEIIFCDADNISTDALYPGRLTYQDNVSQEEMARACMENYDPSFDSITRPNDVLVGGYNLGTGSSREQGKDFLFPLLPLFKSRRESSSTRSSSLHEGYFEDITWQLLRYSENGKI
jgi:homoaconitate hydratase